MFNNYLAFRRLFALFCIGFILMLITAKTPLLSYAKPAKDVL